MTSSLIGLHDTFRGSFAIFHWILTEMAPDFRYGRIRYRKYALFLLRYVLNPRIRLNKKS